MCVSLLPVVEACVVVAVPGRVGEVRVAADEPEAVEQNKISNSYSQFGLRGRAPRGVTGELSPASVYVSLLPVVEACVVVAVPGRVGEVRVAADEPEAVDLDPGVLARRLDAPATVKAGLEQGGRVLAL